MCGFVGTVARRPLSPAEVDANRQLTQLLARRGPDDEGHLVDERSVLGFRRLAVIDLSAAGHQPMSTADGRWAIVFNGEVYNHRELRQELVADGVRFRSTSDTEVVLNALVRWGEAALRRLNGMFGLALLDRREGSVLLARDPLGIKPLAWLEHRDGLVFASQYDAVIRHPWCDRRLRPDVTGLYLRYGYVPSPYGIVERTGQVRPGTVVHWTPEGGRVEREYWSWPEVRPPHLRPDEARERLRVALDASVARQLAADVPVGTFLSGGVDSPLVTAIARQAHRGSVPAFTIGTEDPSLDESLQAAHYAEHLDVDHHLRTITEGDALALFDEVIEAYGEPFGDFSAFPTMLVSRLAREHVTVSLSGDGGDELFFGYPRMWTALRWRRLFHLPPTARRIIRKSLQPWPTIRPNEGSTIGSLGDLVATPHSEFGGDALGRIAPGLDARPASFDLYDLDEVPTADALAQWLRRNEVRGHLEKMLLKVDRASMHESLEVRVPLLDLDLVHAAISIDPFDCIGEGVGKLPLRAELARRVPNAAITTPKKGFAVPLGTWFRGGLAERLRERTVEAPVVLGDAFDRDAIRALIQAHDRGDDHTRPLWHLLSLQEWADHHLRPLPAA